MGEPNLIECPSCGFTGKVRTAPAEGTMVRCTQCKETFTYHAPAPVPSIPRMASASGLAPSVATDLASPPTRTAGMASVPPAKTSEGLEARVATIEKRWRVFKLAAIAVPCLWVAAGIISEVRRRTDPFAHLPMGDFCQVWDAWTPNEGRYMNPTLGFVWTREAELDYTKRGDASLVPVDVDFETIVRVDFDDTAPVMKPYNKIEIDHRGVSIRYVTGPYSGRLGRIKRYKLQRLGDFVED